MTKKTALFFILGVFVAFFVFSLRADDKEERWIHHMIEQAAPNSRLPIAGIFGDLASMENPEMLHLAEHNINIHLAEIADLHARGWTESAIAVHLTQSLTCAQNLTYAQIGTGSISGKLTEHDGGVIEHFASVAAYNEFGHFCGSDYSAYLNNGHYEISNLLPGKYYVRVSSGSYEDQYYRNATDWRKAKKIRVGKNKEKKNINFKLKLAFTFEGDGSISGLVKKKNGIPLKDCRIAVYTLRSNFVNSATTDANGQYTVQNIPSGEYKISCYVEESGAHTTIWYQNALSFEEASTVTVTGPDTTPDIHFNLELGGIIKGKVVGANGKPITAYRASVHAYDMNQNIIRSTTIQEQGKYTLGFLPKGRYKLHVNYYGDENLVSGWYKNAKEFKKAKPILVNFQQIINIRIKLKRGGIIKGTVVDSGGRPIYFGCTIRAYDDKGSYIKYGLSDQKGQFKIQGLESGRYKLHARVSDYPFEGSPQPVSEWYSDKYSYKDAAFVKVTAQRTTGNINFSLSLGGFIACRVQDPYGFPLDYDVSVYAYNLRGELISSAYMANYDRRFAINGLPSGKYRVRVVYFGDEDYINEFYDNKPLFEVADDITVTAPNGTGDIVFQMDYPAVFQGFLTDSKKNRVIDRENHPLDIYAYNAETGEFAGQTDNTFMSGYQLELLKGKYKLAALSGYYNWMTAYNDFGVTYHPQGKKFNDPVTKTYSAKPGSAKKLASLALKKLNGSISGTIYDRDSGLPSTEGIYIVWVFDADGYLVGFSGYADSNSPISGEYRVGGLRPGNYYLLATAVNEFSSISDISLEWYGGVEVPQDELYDYTPKMDIPAGAIPVTVGSNNTGGIDFHLDI